MSNEEKKAIKNLKEVIDLYNDECLITTDYDFKSIEILLNLIEKQSKEIEELKEDKLTIINNFHENWLDKRYVEMMYVNKDKLKAKIEEFKIVRDTILENEKEFNRPMMTYDLKRNDYCEKMLQSLLEKE